MVSQDKGMMPKEIDMKSTKFSLVEKIVVAFLLTVIVAGTLFVTGYVVKAYWDKRNHDLDLYYMNRRDPGSVDFEK